MCHQMGLRVFVGAQWGLPDEMEQVVDLAKALDASFMHVMRSAYSVVDQQAKGRGQAAKL